VTCQSCGTQTDSQAMSCQDMWDHLLAADFSNYRRARLHRRAVDVYSLQHPDPYCRSAKSFAAHLTGLCCAIEHGGRPSVNVAVQRWLSRGADIEKPELPADRGALTISHVIGIDDHGEYERRLDEWCNAVWTAYREHHALARRWIAQALGQESAFDGQG
jgi:hypothetical protein